MTRRRTHSALTRGAALTAAITLSAAVSPPAQANDVVDEIGHFIACFGWMLTDPAAHAANCNPGTPEVRLESLATPGSASGPAAALEGPTGEEEEPGGSGGSGSGSGGTGTGGSEDDDEF